MSDGSVVPEGGLDEITSWLTETWADVLAVDGVTCEDDFFNLGGDSVMATVLVARVEDRYQLLMDPVEVFDFPILRDLAAQIGLKIETPSGTEFAEGEF